MAEFGGIPITESYVVGPDDFLVVNMGPRASMENIDRMRKVLDEKWPDIGRRVVVVSAEELAVIRNGDT